MILMLLSVAVTVMGYGITVSDFPGSSSRPTEDIRCVFVDSEGYVWYGTGGNGLCRFDGYETVIYRSDFNNGEQPGSNTITCISEDCKGNIWYGTTRGACIIDKHSGVVSQLDSAGLGDAIINAVNPGDGCSMWLTSENRVMNYDCVTRKLLFDQIPDESVKGRQFNSIFKDIDGSLWLTQKAGGLFSKTPCDSLFKAVDWPFGSYPTSVIRDGESLLVSTSGDGIVRLDLNSRVFKREENTGRYVSFIANDTRGNKIWAGGNEDLYLYESDSERLRRLDTSSFLPAVSKRLENVFADKAGNMWFVASFPKSFVVSPFPSDVVRHHTQGLDRQIGAPFNPSQIEPDGSRYWVRQKRIGLYVADMSQREIFHFDTKTDLSFFFEKNADGRGIYIVSNDSTITLVGFDGRKFDTETICSVGVRRGERIRAINDDGKGNLWIGTTGKLLKFEKASSRLETIIDSTRFVNEIASSMAGVPGVFVATESDGVFEVSPDSVTRILPVGENYQHVAVSADGSVWVTTLSGRLLRVTPDREVVDETLSCGLDGDVISDIAADAMGRIWVATERKLTVYDHKTSTSRIFVSGDAPIDLESFGAVTCMSDGDTHVAGKGGVFVLPRSMTADIEKENVRVSLTCVRIAGNNYPTEKLGGVITLQPDEKDAELFFSTLSPLDASETRFAFRQKGDDKWTSLPVGQNSLFLTELPCGSYEIEVRATDRFGNWSDKSELFVVDRLPHWYETWWFACACVLLFVVTVALAVWRYNSLQNMKRRRQIEEQVAAMKYNFFTKISHDLRTPLTLIISPVDSLIDSVKDIQVRKTLETVRENAGSLLDLVNQLLDFRKIEMGGESVSVRRVEIAEFIRSICDCFRSEAERRSFDFKVNVPDSQTWIMTDTSKIRKVVNNLLSNAFKFTPDGGQITVNVTVSDTGDRDELTISVADNGKGISPEALPTIFDCFKRDDAASSVSGSGIGLHVVKEYASMLSGNVTVFSKPGVETVFTFSIPVENADMQTVADAETQPMSPSEDREIKKILIVEDNRQFRDYVREVLQPHYLIIEAEDGPDGFAKAVEHHPDIIITDLMMPGYDGVELCHRIKTEVETSHIPVVLLTASGDIENERRSYDEGADAYLSKPFDKAIMLSRIKNLTTRMEIRRQTFKKELSPKPADVTISAIDEELLQKALASVKKNIDNSDYTIETLSDDLCMSRSNLYRKIHSITGMTPTDFVRTTRLKEAAEMLRSTTLSIEEIAYKVGFSSPGYFTRSFKKFFGDLPTVYRDISRQND